MVKQYKLFTYGLLCTGRKLHPLMKDATYLGNLTINGYAIESWPNLYYRLYKEKLGTATGELYLIDEKLKAQLDLVEHNYNFVEIMPDIFTYREK